MRGDPWLDRWLPLIAERAGGTAVLELGCGGGRDTAALCEAGLRVVAIDRSPVSLAKAKSLCPDADFRCQDIRAPFPLEHAGVIVASLSMHYFPWEETVFLADRIRDALRPSGVLLCRLNSSNDHHYGASGHPKIEPGLYLVDGEAKRFFDETDVTRLFGKGWKTLGLGELVVDRYAHPKALWEIVVEKSA